MSEIRSNSLRCPKCGNRDVMVSHTDDTSTIRCVWCDYRVTDRNTKTALTMWCIESALIWGEEGGET